MASPIQAVPPPNTSPARIPLPPKARSLLLTKIVLLTLATLGFCWLCKSPKNLLNLYKFGNSAPLQKSTSAVITEIAKPLFNLPSPSALVVKKLIVPLTPAEAVEQLARKARTHRLLLTKLDPELLNNYDFMNKIVPFDGLALQYASAALKKNKALVLAAVRQIGMALNYVDALLRCDREVVLAALADSGHVLKYADPSLQKDREVVIEAVRKNGLALEFAHPTLRADKEIVLIAIQQNEYALQFADSSLQADHDIVLKAVTICGTALQFAAETLQSEYAIVRAAVSQCGLALKYAAPYLRRNPVLAEIACKQNYKALEFVDDSIKESPDFINAVLLPERAKNYRYLSKKMRQNQTTAAVFQRRLELSTSPASF